MIVVDASAMLEMLRLSPPGERALARVVEGHQSVHAPQLIDLEVLQALRRLARGGRDDALRANRCLEDFLDFALERHGHEALVLRAWELRDSLSAYDAAYVALAEWLECPLLTADARLARAGGHAARVELVGPG